MSEFTYGFALTSELVWSGAPFVALPVFPSLVREGASGGGWDVQIARPTVPLFLQFKISDYMTRSSCKEAQQGFPVPCYRMHLRAGRISNQHELLLKLEASGHEVYYCAPAFHRTQELNRVFLATQVAAQSLWLRPSEVGPLPDDDEHSVSFRRGGPYAFFSVRRDLYPRPFEVIGRQLLQSVREHGVPLEALGYWIKLASLIQELAGLRAVEPQLSLDAAVGRIHPLLAAAYYSSVLFGLQLFLVSERA